MSKSDALRTADAEYETSSYAALARHCYKKPMTTGELTSALGRRKVNALAILNRELMALGADVRGLRQLPALPAVGWVSNELRYCPVCLDRGWHVPLFQFLALIDCPLHGVRLRTGCRRCGGPISVAISLIARSPFGCDSCGAVLAARLDDQPGPAAAALERCHRMFDYDRSAELLNADAVNEARVALSGARLSRYVRRFVCWPDGADLTDNSLLSDVVQVDLSRDDLREGDAERRVKHFYWTFSAMMENNGIEPDISPFGFAHRSIQILHSAPITVASATLALVIGTYVGHPWLPRWSKQQGHSLQSQRSALSPTPAEQVVDAELNGLAAQFIVRLVRLTRLDTPFSWAEVLPEWFEFAVPTRVTPGRLLMRVRSDGVAVLRLLKKHGKRVLQLGPAD